MPQFTNVLVMLDNPSRSSAVFPRALDLVRRHGGTLTLAHVFEGYVHDAMGTSTELDAAELEQREYEARLGLLEHMALEPRAAGLDVRTRVMIGSPFLEVTREVLRQGHDLVMKETSPARSGRSRFFTSQELHLLRKCPAPVWLIKAARSPRLRVIVAAIDPAPYDEERQELNRRIVELAMRVAAGEGATLHVAHAWRLRNEESFHLLRRSLSEDHVQHLMNDERQRRIAHIEEIMRPHRGGNVAIEVDLLKGDPSRVLPALTRSVRADLLVMGTVARSGIAGLIIGNTAENVIDDVTCSVLAVKPRGFVSPVRLPDDDRRGRDADPATRRSAPEPSSLATGSRTSR